MDDPATRPRRFTSSTALITAAQLGNGQAQHQLLQRYEPLVQRIVWKLRLPPAVDREDLAQEARIGLLAAIRSWNPHRGPFPAFADCCATNQVRVALQTATRHKHQLLTHATPLDAPQTNPRTSLGDSHPLTLLDTLPAPTNARTDPETHLLIHEQLTSLLSALPTLTSRERAALTGVLAGDSYQQLAPKLGATPKAASHAAYRARRKLAAALHDAA